MFDSVPRSSSLSPWPAPPTRRPTRKITQRSPEQWLAIVKEQADSGLSVPAFCDSRGISRSTMAYQLALVRKRGQVPTATRKAKVNKLCAPAPVAPSFLPVDVVEDSATRMLPSIQAAELILEDGLLIRLPQQAIDRLLDAVVARISGGR
jgi:hypothetical protein